MSMDTEMQPEMTDMKVIGNGSFGTVYQATLVKTGQTVAVKKVLQDKRFKVGTVALGPFSAAVSCWWSSCLVTALNALYGFRRRGLQQITTKILHAWLSHFLESLSSRLSGRGC